LDKRVVKLLNRIELAVLNHGTEGARRLLARLGFGEDGEALVQSIEDDAFGAWDRELLKRSGRRHTIA
jgi:hypothetical protein